MGYLISVCCSSFGGRLAEGAQHMHHANDHKHHVIELCGLNPQVAMLMSHLEQCLDRLRAERAAVVVRAAVAREAVI